MNWKKIIVLGVVVVVFAISVAFTITNLTNANLLPIEIIINQGKWYADSLIVTELDTIVFATDTLTWRTTNYTNTIGQLILVNVDDEDTLLFATQQTPTHFTWLYPDGGSVKLMPAFMETLYVDVLGSGSLHLQYLYTLVGILNK